MSNVSTRSSWSVAIAGSGGSGAVTTGLLLLEALAHRGCYALMSRSYGPQIRGGESAVMIRFATHEISAQGDYFDAFLALDWRGIARFADEIPLTGESVIICGGNEEDIPAEIRTAQQPVLLAQMGEVAKTLENGRANMIGLGILAEWIGLGREEIDAALQAVLGKKGPAVVEQGRAAIDAGRSLFNPPLAPLEVPKQVHRQPRWRLGGNEASGYGALKGGVRFVAAYPITPASEVLEYLAPQLEKVGGVLLQAEDELASINMIIGASFGGVPSLTATSGPGLSLMVEGLGLAVTSETPVVVACVSRGGPSTGIPTKTEQSDLNLAVKGVHGDAPHLVLAPISIKDTLLTTQWAVYLAEHLQTVAIVLTDQILGQSTTVIDAPAENIERLERVSAAALEGGEYSRYQLTDSDISPMSRPGEQGGQYTADGLEHNPRGTPSSFAVDHFGQSEKRLRKLLDFDYGPRWADISGNDGAELVIVTWGSTHAAVMEAAQRLRAKGGGVKVLAIRLLSPLKPELIRREFEAARQIVVVELNQSGQLAQLLHAEQILPHDTPVLCRPGPLFFRPGEIVSFIDALEGGKKDAA